MTQRNLHRPVHPPSQADHPAFLPRSCDRRRRHWRALLWGTVRARRRRARRACDRTGYYVDWYESHLLFVAVAVLLLSCADAALTLTLLQTGAEEANFLMAWLIDTDLTLFAGVKLGLTGMGLVVLVMHARFRVFRSVKVSHVLHLLVPVYLLLTVYEIALLA